MKIVSRSTFIRLLIITFVLGFTLSSSIFVWMEYDYEKSIIESIVDKAKKNNHNNNLTGLVDTLLLYNYQIQDPNTEILFTGRYNYLKKIITPPSFSNFYFGEGVCGSYSAFFTRLMKYSGYKAYTVQVNVGNIIGGHMAVCVIDSDKMYLVDPYFCFSFKDSTNHLSDINDVSKNWHSYYVNKLPSNYPKSYDYQNGWRFTNWDKFGIFSNSVYKLCSSIFGKQKMDVFCFRYYILGYNKYIAASLGIISILLFIILASIYKKIKVVTQKLSALR